MRVFNQTRQTLLINKGQLADTFWLRLKGLLGRTSLQIGEGLILASEKSIHTLFMRFPIDVVYVDKTHKVIRVDKNMLPYRLGPFLTQSAYILEVPIGVITETDTQVGDQLKFEEPAL